MVTLRSKTSIMFVSILLILAFGFQGALPVQAGAETLQAGTIYRVTTTGATSGACGTAADWSTPCDLKYALSIATSGAEIWAQQGTYYTGTIRDDYFSLKNGVAVYGGFVGTETVRTQRNSNPATNGTILSGDFAGTPATGDDAYHVVVGNFVNSNTILDGFTITKGNGMGPGHFYGGGRGKNSIGPAIATTIDPAAMCATSFETG